MPIRALALLSGVALVGCGGAQKSGPPSKTPAPPQAPPAPGRSGGWLRGGARVGSRARSHTRIHKGPEGPRPTHAYPRRCALGFPAGPGATVGEQARLRHSMPGARVDAARGRPHLRARSRRIRASLRAGAATPARCRAACPRRLRRLLDMSSNGHVLTRLDRRDVPARRPLDASPVAEEHVPGTRDPGRAVVRRPGPPRAPARHR